MCSCSKIRLDSMSNIAAPSANYRFAFVLRCVCCSLEANDYSVLLFIIINSNYIINNNNNNINSNSNNNNNSSCCKHEMRVLSFHISNNSSFLLDSINWKKTNFFCFSCLINIEFDVFSSVVVVFYCSGCCCCYCCCEGLVDLW